MQPFCMQHSSGLTETPLNRYQSRWHSMEFVIGNQLQKYQLQLPTTLCSNIIVQSQLQLQLLQKCNQLQLITITN